MRYVDGWGPPLPRTSLWRNAVSRRFLQLYDIIFAHWLFVKLDKQLFEAYFCLFSR